MALLLWKLLDIPFFNGLLYALMTREGVEFKVPDLNSDFLTN